jgi:folate-dependent phosphoribosylglycinamide formyltransferase PurN
MTRIVLTTADSLHGQRVLQRIYERGILLDAVLMLTGTFGPPRAKGAETRARRLLRWPRAAASAARRKLRFARGRRASYATRCRQVIATGDMNSRRLRRDLRRLAPDFLVLGGGGILSPEIIETARVGVLNAHPALLPWVRGCGVVGHSLEQGIALGATVHLVDRGIDTGAVVARRLLAVPPGPASLAALELAADELAAEMMADVVEGIIRRGEIPRGVPQTERHPLYRWPPPAERPRHEALAASGRAHELFERWRPLCTDTARWTLPPESIEIPSTTLGRCE